MWRWQSLAENVLPEILSWRGTYSSKLIGSGLEWNVPGHERCSTGIVAFDALAISAFEYQFDASNDDTSREGEVTPYAVLTKQNGARHEWVDGEKVSTGLDREDANLDVGRRLRLDEGHVRSRSLRETTITVTAARQIGGGSEVRQGRPALSQLAWCHGNAITVNIGKGACLHAPIHHLTVTVASQRSAKAREARTDAGHYFRPLVLPSSHPVPR